MNVLTENARIRSQASYHTDEHILVCLSSSPSNPKIIRTAARMAKAFNGSFTALFVETSSFSLLSQEDKKRLRSNIHLAEQLGAKVETAYGEDVPLQIVEFARLSGASKIVIGRSIASVLIFNFLFTDPKFSLQAYDKGYPVTFFIMFIAASITGSLATRLKQQAKQSARAAYRTKVLFDTNQLLQQASDQEEIIATTSQQLLKLLNRSVIFFMEEGGWPEQTLYFPSSRGSPRLRPHSPSGKRDRGVG